MYANVFFTCMYVCRSGVSRSQGLRYSRQVEIECAIGVTNDTERDIVVVAVVVGHIHTY